MCDAMIDSADHIKRPQDPAMARPQIVATKFANVPGQNSVPVLGQGSSRDQTPKIMEGNGLDSPEGV
jgi:uncharacterized protein (DUF362 family)